MHGDFHVMSPDTPCDLPGPNVQRVASCSRLERGGGNGRWPVRAETGGERIAMVWKKWIICHSPCHTCYGIGDTPRDPGGEGPGCSEDAGSARYGLVTMCEYDGVFIVVCSCVHEPLYNFIICL